MAASKTIPAVNRSATSNTGAVPSAFTFPQSASDTLLSTIGFGSLNLSDLLFVNPVTQQRSEMSDAYLEAITDIIYEKNMNGVTTVTLQTNDPTRALLRTVVQQGTELIIQDQGREVHLSFTQETKASDQLQLAFESTTVYRLSNQRNAPGTTTTYTSTAVTQFMASLVYALNYSGSPYAPVSFVAPDYQTIWGEISGFLGKAPLAVGLGRGTTVDPFEDSWTCMTRIASTIGWRLWENNGTVYFGPDEYWLGILTASPQGIAQPPVNVALGTTGTKIPILKEFGPDIMLIDYDWDVNKPYAQATVTCMLDGWTYDIGEIVQTTGLGRADGYWMVYDMQRDFYNPQATMTLQVPTPYPELYEPNSLPLPGFPLSAKFV
jgi:hypothetical protein